VTALALVAIAIPTKNSGDESISSQTTESNNPPLKWAITQEGSDKNNWLNRTDNLKQALVFFTTKYGGNYKLLYDCIVVESGWNENAVGDGGLAKSLAQIHADYWQDYCIGDRTNPYNNLECFAKQNSKHIDTKWSCWKHLLNT
jgi:hypothetical protein